MNKKDMKTLANKVIVITGASSGIGEAMAKVYAAQGAKVVLGARNVQKLQFLAGDIRARGGQAAYCGVDVTKPEECRELIETAVREFGGIDVLICNAGISMRAIFDDVDLGVLHRLMDGSRDFIDMGNGLRMSLARNKTSANRLDIIYDEGADLDRNESLVPATPFGFSAFI